MNSEHLSRIVSKVRFISRGQRSQITMFALDLVWELLCLVEVEMIVYDIHNLNCSENEPDFGSYWTSDISLAKRVMFMLGK